MGRLKKFQTEGELAEARRGYSKKYYWKNKEKVDERVRKNNQRIKREKGSGSLQDHQP